MVVSALGYSFRGVVSPAHPQLNSTASHQPPAVQCLFGSNVSHLIGLMQAKTLRKISIFKNSSIA
jgi:hypothetical protein